MLAVKSLLLLAAAFVSADSSSQVPDPSLNINPDYVPGRFIVEFADPSGLSKRSVDSDPANAFTELLNSQGVSATSAFKYTNQHVFIGASIDAISKNFASDLDLLQHLQSLPDVKQAWPVRRITAYSANSNSEDIPISKQKRQNTADSSASGDFANAQNEQTFHQDSSFNFPTWSPHNITGVDVLHSRGITGKNVTIGIIDSGAFYLDPALGGGFGPGYKIVGGYNYMGNIYDPSVQGFAFPNNNTLDCLGHGTHVTGIAAATNKIDNPYFVGVAPDASVRSYKVFGCTESTSEDVVVAAIQQAYTDGCDIINLSLGADGGGFQNNPLGLAIDKVASNGVFVASSAGNSGPNGPFNGNEDATGRLVTSVGATSTGQLIGYEATAKASNGDTFRFTYIAPTMVQLNTSVGSFPLTVVSQDACSIGNSAPHGSGNSAVILPQGNCTGTKFYLATHNLGYKLVVSYQEDFAVPSSAYPQYLDDSVLHIQAERDLSDWVERETSQGQTVEIVFTEDSFVPRTLLNTNNIGPAYYSSLGPDFSGYLYPHVSAPGTGIFSTYLNNTYAVLDGTSMSAPYISGVIALYIQSIGGRPSGEALYEFVTDIQRRLIHTASPITIGSNVAPLIQVGSGLVNATKLVDSKTYFGASSLSLGLNPDTTNVDVLLYNDGDSAVTYKLSHIEIPTTLTKSGPNGLILDSLPLVYQSASIAFDSDTIVVQAHSSSTISASFQLPKNIASSFAPVYQGKFLAVSEDGSQNVVLPYLATVTDQFPVWTEERTPLFFYDVNNNGIMGGANYSTTKANYKGTPDDSSIPWINVSYNSIFYTPVLSGAQLYNLAVVAENFTNFDLSLPLNPGKNGVTGIINGYPVSMYPRTQDGLYSIISTPGIPTGKYRLLALALPAVPDGPANFNSTSPDNYEIFLTDVFGFNDTSTYPSPSSSSQTNAFSSPNAGNLGGILTYIGTVRSASTNSSVAISPYDVLRVAIPFRALNGFNVGSSFSIELPEELTDFPPSFNVLSDSGEIILDVSINGNNLTSSVVADPGETYITGDLVFGARLKNPQQYLGADVTRIPLVFKSPNYAKTATPNILDITPYDPLFPSLGELLDGNSRSADLYLPTAFNEWSNLTVSFKTSGVSVSCGSVAVRAGSNLTESLTSLESFNGASINCNGLSSQQLQVKLGSAPGNNEGVLVQLPLTLPSNQNVSIEGKVEATLSGTLSGEPFEYRIERYIIGNNYVEYTTPLTGEKKLTSS